MSNAIMLSFKNLYSRKDIYFGDFWRVASLPSYTLYLITLCNVDVALFLCFNF